jgi:hypothetical protein
VPVEITGSKTSYNAAVGVNKRWFLRRMAMAVATRQQIALAFSFISRRRLLVFSVATSFS